MQNGKICNLEKAYIQSHVKRSECSQKVYKTSIKAKCKLNGYILGTLSK